MPAFVMIDCPNLHGLSQKNNYIVDVVGISMEGNYQPLYHKLIELEYKKLQKSNLRDVFLEAEDLKGLSTDFSISDIKKGLEYLYTSGFLLKLESNKLRTLHMDLAVRASDIRVKHGGNKYVFEANLKLKKRPILKNDYVKLLGNSHENQEILACIRDKIRDETLAKNLLKAFSDAGIKGLSSYQFKSFLEVLSNKKDTVISAPTGFGKTYVFLLPLIVEVMAALAEGIEGCKGVIFFPRKSLGSDQMGRLIKLVYEINKTCKIKMRIAIDDGNTPLSSNIKNGETFRGIKCPEHKETSLIIKNGRVYCPNGHFLDFIPVTKEEIKDNAPDILITNIWAYQFKIVNREYWGKYLSSNIKYFIFDEIHAYNSLSSGILKYFIKILRALISPSAKIVLSSATIPALESFAYKMLGHSSNTQVLEYDEKVHGKDSEKLELYLMVGINPYSSWETYLHQLAVMLSTANRLRDRKNIQSLIFVDSIRNINRLYYQTLETVKLGDPKDHLDEEIAPHDPYCYWIYNQKYKESPQILDSSEKIMELRKEILENIEMHYSSRPNRFEIEERIKSGKIDVVYTTSTLELGVDYDNVSVVVNAGIPFSLGSIVQRVGRAGRNVDTTLNTSLSVILIRNNHWSFSISIGAWTISQK